MKTAVVAGVLPPTIQGIAADTAGSTENRLIADAADGTANSDTIALRLKDAA